MVLTSFLTDSLAGRPPLRPRTRTAFSPATVRSPIRVRAERRDQQDRPDSFQAGQVARHHRANSIMLEWLRDPALRRRVTAGSIRAKHTMPWLGRSVSTDSAKFATTLSKTSATEPAGLNLIVAAITLRNTVYLRRATSLLETSHPFVSSLLQHVSPLGWEHVNLTGDYTLHSNKRVAKGGFHPIRIPRNARNGFGAP